MLVQEFFFVLQKSTCLKRRSFLFFREKKESLTDFSITRRTQKKTKEKLKLFFCILKYSHASKKAFFWVQNPARKDFFRAAIKGSSKTFGLVFWSRKVFDVSWFHDTRPGILRHVTVAAQYAFKSLMTHWVVQFALRIAVRSVLHRYTSREIHRWKSFVFF